MLDLMLDLMPFRIPMYCWVTTLLSFGWTTLLTMFWIARCTGSESRYGWHQPTSTFLEVHAEAIVFRTKSIPGEGVVARTKLVLDVALLKSLKLNHLPSSCPIICIKCQKVGLFEHACYGKRVSAFSQQVVAHLRHHSMGKNKFLNKL